MRLYLTISLIVLSLTLCGCSSSNEETASDSNPSSSSEVYSSDYSQQEYPGQVSPSTMPAVPSYQIPAQPQVYATSPNQNYMYQQPIYQPSTSANDWQREQMAQALEHQAMQYEEMAMHYEEQHERQMADEHYASSSFSSDNAIEARYKAEELRQKAADLRMGL